MDEAIEPTGCLLITCISCGPWKPIRDIVLAESDGALPPYLDMSSPSVLPVVVLRSCLLFITPQLRYSIVVFFFLRRDTVRRTTAVSVACVFSASGIGEYTADERRRRLGQHVLCLTG